MERLSSCPPRPQSRSSHWNAPAVVRGPLRGPRRLTTLRNHGFRVRTGSIRNAVLHPKDRSQGRLRSLSSCPAWVGKAGHELPVADTWVIEVTAVCGR